MKEKKNKLNYSISLLLAIMLIAFDQLTKYLATIHLKGNEDIIIINDIFKLTYVENRGSAFGIMQGWRTCFLIMTTILVAGIVFIYVKLPREAKFTPLRGCAILLLSGAIGNMIDRIYHSFVVDFLYFELIDFPVFNTADVYITVSIAIIIILTFFYYKEEDFIYAETYFKRK